MKPEGVSGLYRWVIQDPDFPPYEPDFENMKDITPKPKQLGAADDKKEES